MNFRYGFSALVTIKGNIEGKIVGRRSINGKGLYDIEIEELVLESCSDKKIYVPTSRTIFGVFERDIMQF